MDMAQANAWGASVIENRGGTKVCSLPPPNASSGEAQVCAAPTGPVIEPLPDDAGGNDAAPPSSDAAPTVDAALSSDAASGDAASGSDAATP